MESNVNSNNNEVSALRTGLVKVEKNLLTLEKAVNESAKTEKHVAAEILVEVFEMKTFVKDNRPLKEREDVITFSQFMLLHQVTFPMKNVEEFNQFEELLKNETNNMAADLVS